MTPEEEQRLAELEELERLRLEVGSTSTETPDLYPTEPQQERSWLESGYDFLKNYGVPAAQMGIDVGTSVAKVGGPAGWLAQPVISSALGWYPEVGLRLAGETADNLFGTNFEPDAGYQEILTQSSDNAIANAALGVGIGAASGLVGKGVKTVGKKARGFFDTATARRAAVYAPDKIPSAPAQNVADEAIEALQKEGVFPVSLERNPYLHSAQAIENIKTREAGVLASLRKEVDDAGFFRTRSSILDPQANPQAAERYIDYNRAISPTADQEKVLTSQIQKEATLDSLNLSQIAARKASYLEAAGSFPADTYAGGVQQTFSKLMQIAEKEAVTEYFTKTNQPEKLAQYLASLKLYGQAESAMPVIAARAGDLATAVNSSRAIGASYGSQSGVRFFNSLGALVDDPKSLHVYEKGFTPQSSFGKWMGTSGGDAIAKAGQGIIKNAGALGSMLPTVVEMSGKVNDALGESRNSPLLQNLTEPKAVAISRNLNSIDAAAIDALIPAFVEDYNAQPLQFQFKRLVAEGDKSKIADFLGQLSAKYPDFPIQRGQVTGLPSEFDLGDGVARLISPQDKAEYERRVNVSDLDLVEKAHRIKAIREQGIAHRFDVPLVTDIGTIGLNRNPSNPRYQYAPRVQTESGSRKVE